jgi:succinoglycan biosynthesis transport protein ExoP
MARQAGGEVIPLGTVRGDQVPMLPRGGPASDEMALRDYVAVLSKRRWVFATFLVTVVATAAVWVWRQPRIYRATATLEISMSAPKFTTLQDVGESSGGLYWQTREFNETQYQVIRSRMVAQRVVDELHLASDEQFLGVDGIKDPAKRAKAVHDTDAVERLRARLVVESIKDSRVARVSVEDTSPERAARLTNAVADAYVAVNLERKLETTRAASVWLADQLDSLKAGLESSEKRLHAFKEENDILTASLEDRQGIFSQRLTALSDALTRASVRRAELEPKRRSREVARRRAAAGDAHAYAALEQVAKSASVAQLRSQLLALEQERGALGRRYLDKHPKLAEVDGRIDGARRALEAEVASLVALEEREWREAAETEQRLSEFIEKAKRENFALNARAVDFNRLKRDQDNNGRLYDVVLSRLKDTELLGHQATNNVAVLDRALVPDSSVKPNRRTVMLLALLLGVVGGLALALFFEYLDDTLKGPDEVEKLLGLPFLGLVPEIRQAGQEQTPEAERGRQRDLQAHRKPKSSVAECVRTIRTNLLFSTPDQPLRRLLVTSSSPQEGKTTVATNLAITMAQNGARTLLVDTDMRRPRIHRAFGLPNDAGVSSLILGQARIEEVVQETLVPNLFLLPCGPIPPNPAELLHSRRFEELCAELDGRFDRIVFDSPPVVAVTDALILSGHVDGVVLVVKAGRTARDMARRTAQLLGDVKARLFGVVVNAVDLERRGHGAYYYYYQRYGYYYGEKPADG